MIPKKDDNEKPFAYVLQTRRGGEWKDSYVRPCRTGWREDVDRWCRQSPDHRAVPLFAGEPIGENR